MPAAVGFDGFTRTLRAGELAAPGRYVRVDCEPSQVVVLDRAGYLPVSFDGHVAEYRPLTFTPPARVQPHANRLGDTVAIRLQGEC
ncbi:MAG: hypothetical protein HY329_21680 [Chloroflexi bacterium]|nr:hypothetical protein [Chloroflexota bacterium]